MTTFRTKPFGAPKIRTALFVSEENSRTGRENLDTSAVAVPLEVSVHVELTASVTASLELFNVGTVEGSELVEPLDLARSLNESLAPVRKVLPSNCEGSTGLESTVNEMRSKREKSPLQSNPNENGRFESAKYANSSTSPFRYGTEDRNPVSQDSFRT